MVVAAMSPRTPAATPARSRAAAVFDQPLEPVVENQGEGEGRQEYPGGDRHTPREPAGRKPMKVAKMISGAGRPRKEQAVEELAVADPPRPTASSRRNGIAV